MTDDVIWPVATGDRCVRIEDNYELVVSSVTVAEEWWTLYTLQYEVIKERLLVDALDFPVSRQSRVWELVFLTPGRSNTNRIRQLVWQSDFKGTAACSDVRDLRIFFFCTCSVWKSLCRVIALSRIFLGLYPFTYTFMNSVVQLKIRNFQCSGFLGICLIYSRWFSFAKL